MLNPVFIYSSWRTSSTWIWKKFRDLPDAHAYCEIYHEGLTSANMGSIAKISPRAWKASRHPDSAPYFLEFTPLFSPGGQGVRGMTPDLVLEQMFPPRGASLGASEMDYLNGLITLAESGKKIPVLTCTRNLGRAPATRLSFPNGVHIVTVRNLWHQWMSFCEQHLLGNSYFLEQIDHIILTTITEDPILAHLRERFTPTDDLHAGEPPPERLLYAFIGLHLYMYGRAFQAADLIVDINRLAINSCYRRDTENKIHELTGLPLDFSDISSRIEYGPTPLPCLEELRANVEPLFLVACDGTGISADDEAESELRYIVNELYEESMKYGFYTKSLRSEHSKMVETLNQTSDKLIETTTDLKERDRHIQFHMETLNNQSIAIANHEKLFIAINETLSSHEGTISSHVEELTNRAKDIISEGRKNEELQDRVRHLEYKLEKGPLRIRQLLRHPKAYARETFGLKSEQKPNHYPLLRNGYVDEVGECRISTGWMLRQPRKAFLLILRHPRKVFRYVVRHPKKTLTLKGCYSLKTDERSHLAQAESEITKLLGPEDYIHKAPPIGGIELFDFSWYQNQHETKFLTLEDAYNDYVNNGWRKGRSPHPLFDITWYLTNNPDIANSGIEPFTHYLNHGSNEGRDPHPLFNLRWYLKENPQAIESNLEPLYHFTKVANFIEAL